MLKIFYPAILLIIALPVLAAVDIYEFSSEDNRHQYQQLTEELRCPKCQNQNLAGSDSPIAADLRRELHRLVEEGRSDADIRAFMVARYGDFVLYRPPVQENTLLLWWGPPAVLGLGVLILLVLVWRRHRVMQNDGTTALSPEEQAKINALLAQEQSLSSPQAKPSEPKPSTPQSFESGGKS